MTSSVSRVVIGGNIPNVAVETVGPAVADVTGAAVEVSAEAPAEIHGLATLIQFGGLVVSVLSLVIPYLSWREKRRDDWSLDKLLDAVREKLATRSVLDFEVVGMEGYQHLTDHGAEPCVVKVRSKKDNSHTRCW